MKKTAILFATGLMLSAASYAQTWSVDKGHSRVGFAITHLTINDIDGNFKSYDAKITSSKADFSDASIEFSADMNSINTDIESRDTHLKGADFFDVEKNPKMTFKSTSFKKGIGKEYKVAGNLTLHGVTKPVTFTAVLVGTATNPMSKKEMAGFRLTGDIKRTDFGIAATMPESMLSDKVKLIANTEFAKD
ncbi:MAG: YceI like family protein [Flavipsychrobacter sp.]|nr:YceI like family protein [Flavipsychrobacter sp.]